MATRVTSRPSGRNYLGNTNTKEIHDLRNERPQCQLDETIRAGHAVVFPPDTLAQAHAEGYDNGHFCIGGSQR